MGTFLFKWEHEASEVYVTGTFDNWSKSERLIQTGNVFEKTVTLPSAAEKIYYKVREDEPSAKFAQNPEFCFIKFKVYISPGPLRRQVGLEGLQKCVTQACHRALSSHVCWTPGIRIRSMTRSAQPRPAFPPAVKLFESGETPLPDYLAAAWLGILALGPRRPCRLFPTPPVEQLNLLKEKPLAQLLHPSHTLNKRPPY